jgi:TonB dependent receptor-like, beta-barrel
MNLTPASQGPLTTLIVAPNAESTIYYSVKDEDNGAPLTAIPADKLVAQLGVRDPGWGLSAGLQSRFVDRQDRVPEGVLETPGYAVYDLYASWLPGSASLLGLRLDFGIDNLTDKAYRRHLSVLDEAGQNFKISVSYQFLTMGEERSPYDKGNIHQQSLGDRAGLKTAAGHASRATRSGCRPQAWPQ